MDALGKGPGFADIRGGGFAPHDVGVGGVGTAPGNGQIKTALDIVEAFNGAGVENIGFVHRVDIRCNQACGIGVGTGDEHRGNPQHIRCQTGCGKFGGKFHGGDKHLAAHVSALFQGRYLILEMHPGGSASIISFITQRH